jgi:hypothetical protein
VPADFAQQFVRALLEARGSESYRETGRRSGLAAMTVRAIILGERWPDMVSVVRLEQAYGELLWPTDAYRRRLVDQRTG